MKSFYRIIMIASLLAAPQAASADNNDQPLTDASAIKRLYQGYYTYENTKAPYEACMKFKKTGQPYTQYMDQTLADNFKRFQTMYLDKMNITAKCLDVSQEEQDKARKRAENNYQDSDNATIYKMGVAMVIAGQENVKKFVNGCNTMSQSYSALYSESKDETIDPETCESTGQD